MWSRRSLLLGFATLVAAGASGSALAEQKKTTLVEIFRRKQKKSELGAAIEPVARKQKIAAVPGQKPAKSKAKKPFVLDPKYEPQSVKFSG